MFKLRQVLPCCVLMALTTFVHPAVSQNYEYNPNELRGQVNRGTVMIQGAKQDSAFTRLANDIATVVDSDDIRVLPLLGKGSFQNIMDLMFLNGVDASFTQSDTLDLYQQLEILPHLGRDLRYIMRTSDEEFHLLASSSIKSIQDLEGKKVNFGRNGTGTFTTSSVVFDRLGISVEATTFPHKQALALLKQGEIDAMAKVDGKPVGVIAEANLDDGLRLIGVPVDQLDDTYVAATLNADDYPTLFARGDEVTTIAVPSLLAVYNFPPDNPRSAKVDKFIRALFANFDDLKSEETGGDAKWQEIDLSREVPGWTRHPTAEALLKPGAQAALPQQRQ
ncbi:MAG: TAXI family TRAP transporter solute-binding subunit [Geminicoccaceae bacterium]